MTAILFIGMGSCVLYLGCWGTAMAIVGSEFEHQPPRNWFERFLAIGCLVGGLGFFGSLIAFAVVTA